MKYAEIPVGRGSLNMFICNQPDNGRLEFLELSKGDYFDYPLNFAKVLFVWPDFPVSLFCFPNLNLEQCDSSRA